MGPTVAIEGRSVRLNNEAYLALGRPARVLLIGTADGLMIAPCALGRVVNPRWSVSLESLDCPKRGTATTVIAHSCWSMRPTDNLGGSQVRTLLFRRMASLLNGPLLVAVW